MFEITVRQLDNGKWERSLYCIADKTTEISIWNTRRQAIAGHD